MENQTQSINVLYLVKLGGMSEITTDEVHSCAAFTPGVLP